MAPDPRSAEDVLKLFPSSLETTVVADRTTELKCHTLAKIKRGWKKLDSRKAQLEDDIKVTMLQADRLEHPDGTELATWRSQKANPLRRTFLLKT